LELGFNFPSGDNEYVENTYTGGIGDHLRITSTAVKVKEGVK
jgi:hypothetical protein